MSFWNLLKVSLKGIYRNQSGLFWTIVMPVAIYLGVALLPINQFLKQSLPYPHYLLPGILAMQIMQGGIYGLAYWMVDMRARGVLRRFAVTPVKTSELVVALLSARVVVMLMQVVVMTALGVLAFHVPFAWNIISITVFTLLGGGIFLLMGLLIATFATTYESAAPITAGIGLPLTFLGNIFYPVSTLPHALQIFSKLLPITYLADGFRKVYLEPFNFSAISLDLVVLAVWFLVLLPMVVWRFKLEE